MNVRKIVARFSAAPKEPTELRRVARALSNELPRERLEVLCDFRAAMARVSWQGEDTDPLTCSSFAAGYVESMLDITAEYETAIRAHSDAQEAERMALREGWCDVLAALHSGLRLPSEIADHLREDRSRITRVLSKLRAAGLVEMSPHDPLDGRTRPHRLTTTGRGALERVISDEGNGTVQGIRVAIALIGLVMGREATAVHDLERVAYHILGDLDSAARAVEIWTQIFTESGMLRDLRPNHDRMSRAYAARTEASDTAARAEATPVGGTTSTPANEHRPDAYGRAIPVDIRPSGNQPANGNAPVHTPIPGAHSPASDSAQLSASVSSGAPWQQVPRVLALVRQSTDDPVPLYVRTNDASWPAWAFTLGQDNASQSRAIIDGDLLTQAITPPQTPYRLLYDDPSALRADEKDPTMRALIESADEKYLVTYAGAECDDVPQGFVQLDISQHSEST